MSIRTDFYAAFTAAADRPIRRSTNVLSAKGSLAFPSSTPGEYHSLAIVAYAGRFEHPTRLLIPRISLNHYRHELSPATANAFNIITGRPRGSGWHSSDTVLELTVAADELQHWPTWLWAFVKARESGDASLLLPEPSVIDGESRDWMGTRYEWTHAAAQQYAEYRREQDLIRKRRAAFRSRLTAGAVGAIT